jgi:hypothetical protein
VNFNPTYPRHSFLASGFQGRFATTLEFPRQNMTYTNFLFRYRRALSCSIEASKLLNDCFISSVEVT